MASEWQELALVDIAVKDGGMVDGPFGSNLPASSYVDHGIPVIRGSNLSIGSVKFKNDEFVYVSALTFEKLKRSECLCDDIVFTKKGTLGQTGIIPVESKYKRYVLSSNQMRLRVDLDKADALFVYYAVSSCESIEKIKRDSECTGVPKINLDYLKKFPIKLPNIAEQKAIAHILGSLDDKIELNRQINTTLEAMAQALFKSWFVDFDPVIDNALAAGNPIPDELEAKAAARQALGDARKPLPEDIRSLFPNAFVFTEEMGWIPEGWVIRSLESLITLIGGGTPKTSIEAYWNGDIPWFSVVDAPNPSDVFVIETEKHITRLGVEKSSTKILPIGTTIISARGTVGKCAMVATPMAMNQSCYGIRGIDGISDTFIYYSIYLQVTDLQQKSHGSIFSTITRDTFKSIQMPFSNAPLTVAFDQIVKPYFDKILANSIQAKALTNLRDTLLPKLLSGELRIPEAELLVEESVA